MVVDSGDGYGGDVDFQNNSPENQKMPSALEAAIGNIEKLSDEDPWKMNGGSFANQPNGVCPECVCCSGGKCICCTFTFGHTCCNVL